VIQNMWWHGFGMTPWGYALTTVGMLLFWQLAVFGMILLIRYLGGLNKSVAERPVPRSCLPSKNIEVISPRSCWWPVPGRTFE
jgi:hypothetical protein